MLCTGKRRTKRLFYFFYHLTLDGEQIEKKTHTQQPTNRLNMREHMQRRAYNWISMFALEKREEKKERKNRMAGLNGSYEIHKMCSTPSKKTTEAAAINAAVFSSFYLKFVASLCIIEPIHPHPSTLFASRFFSFVRGPDECALLRSRLIGKS